MSRKCNRIKTKAKTALETQVSIYEPAYARFVLLLLLEWHRLVYIYCILFSGKSGVTF